MPDVVKVEDRSGIPSGKKGERTRAVYRVEGLLEGRVVQKDSAVVYRVYDLTNGGEQTFDSAVAWVTNGGNIDIPATIKQAEDELVAYMESMS